MTLNPNFRDPIGDMAILGFTAVAVIVKVATNRTEVCHWAEAKEAEEASKKLLERMKGPT